MYWSLGRPIHCIDSDSSQLCTSHCYQLLALKFNSTTLLIRDFLACSLPAFTRWKYIKSWFNRPGIVHSVWLQNKFHYHRCQLASHIPSLCRETNEQVTPTTNRHFIHICSRGKLGFVYPRGLRLLCHWGFRWLLFKATTNYHQALYSL